MGRLTFNETITGDSHQSKEGQRRKLVLNEIVKGFIILFIAVGGFKYIAWNFHKMEQSAEVTSRIINAPPAVNLIVSKEKLVLFKKSFPDNNRGNYYIVNHFDLSPYIPELSDTGGNSLELTVNGKPIHSFLLFRFERFNILYSVDHTFVFTTHDCGIEGLLRLRKRMPFLRAALLKLAFPGGNSGSADDANVNLKNFIGETPVRLKYGEGIFSLPIPAAPKGEIYEITFEYNVTGSAVPVLMASDHRRSGENVLFRKRLYIPKKGSFRKVGFLFPAPDKMDSFVFHIAARFRGHRPDRKGEVNVRNISISRLGNEAIFQQAAPLVRSLAPTVYYSDALEKMEGGFIECIREPGEVPK
jgi:hypothetical protein